MGSAFLSTERVAATSRRCFPFERMFTLRRYSPPLLQSPPLLLSLPNFISMPSKTAIAIAASSRSRNRRNAYESHSLLFVFARQPFLQIQSTFGGWIFFKFKFRSQITFERPFIDACRLGNPPNQTSASEYGGGCFSSRLRFFLSSFVGIGIASSFAPFIFEGFLSHTSRWRKTAFRDLKNLSHS